jgi:hypothetical protein
MDAEHVVVPYLAGRLPADDSDAFEQYVSEHPEICAEIEQTLKLTEGLARLRERGELDGLLRAPASRRWVPYAAAASVALATVAGLLWLQLRSAAPAILFHAPSELAARQHHTVAIRGSYVLARTRGSASVTDVAIPSQPGAIELRIVPSGASSDLHYSVSLRQLRGAAAPAKIEAGPVAADGYVTIYVDSGRLTPGEYEVALTPLVSDGSPTESDSFVIRLKYP